MSISLRTPHAMPPLSPYHLQDTKANDETRIKNNMLFLVSKKKMHNHSVPNRIVFEKSTMVEEAQIILAMLYT
jgi:hypothetical protein